ncbi:hypothetical protein E3U55_09130 [Filobacillus milosensis]|uniref:Uncharacterized protein n=1 Tax=Filobacillus milosensis TaxID=94137 RepID=A0A4Y8IS65_9BACI|nr:hypothetical protein [Filobacillus milosensis]TFB21463.1 hypothetical protein E3U55_09130 [Filobacillus milosensis]
MANIAIYYQKNSNESTEQAVLRVNELIKQLETLHIIKGVFLDNFGQSTELMDLLNSPLSVIDYMYINKPLENEFDNELIDQLKRTEQFQVRYFSEI